MHSIVFILLLAGCSAKFLYTPHIHPHNTTLLHCSVGIGDIEVPDYAAIGKIYDSKTKNYVKNFRLSQGLDEVISTYLLQTLPVQSLTLYPWAKSSPQVIIRISVYHFVWDEEELMMDGMVTIGTKHFSFKHKVRAVSLPKAIDEVLQSFLSFVNKNLPQMCKK